jgi:hypothetical protein
LIGGKRLPVDADLPSGQYFAFVSRAEWRPMSDVYAWSIRDPLPTIPIPLMAPDPDIPLDLAAIFQTVYQRARYERSIDYKAPLGLPLSPEHRAGPRRSPETSIRAWRIDAGCGESIASAGRPVISED